MKNETVLQVAGVVAAGVVAYLLVSRTIAAGGKVVEGAKKVLTEDLNPASGKNIVTQTLQSTEAGRAVHEKVGDFLGRVFDPKGYAKMKEAEAMLGGGTSRISNTAEQVAAYAQGGPSTGVYAQPAPDQTAAEDARLRRGEATLTAKKYADNLFDMYYNGDTYGMMQ